MKEYINEALEKYIEKGTYPWHMPGHKRQPIEAVQNVDNISKSRESEYRDHESCVFQKSATWMYCYDHLSDVQRAECQDR